MPSKNPHPTTSTTAETNVKVIALLDDNSAVDEPTASSKKDVPKLPIKMISDTSLRISIPTKSTKERYEKPLEYSFDYVFDSKMLGKRQKNTQLYDRSVRLLVDGAMTDVINGTIISYGMAETGKTDILFAYDNNGDMGVAEDGIALRALRQIFTSIKAKSAKYKIGLQFVEFCGDTTHDLLALFESAKNIGTQNDEITVSSDRRNTKIELCGAREVFAESYIRAMYIILFGLKQFHRRTTVEVTTKQRHMLLNVTLQQQIKAPIIEQYNSTLQFVDLAEIPKNDTGDLDRSCDKILATFNEIISNLSSPSSKTSSKKPLYQETKLTHLLFDSFGGKSRTVMIMSINPTLGHYKLASTIVEKAQEMRKITNKLVPNKKIKHVEPWTDDNSAENSDEVEANASKIIANEELLENRNPQVEHPCTRNFELMSLENQHKESLVTLQPDKLAEKATSSSHTGGQTDMSVETPLISITPPSPILQHNENFTILHSHPDEQVCQKGTTSSHAENVTISTETQISYNTQHEVLIADTPLLPYTPQDEQGKQHSSAKNNDREWNLVFEKLDILTSEVSTLRNEMKTISINQKILFDSLKSINNNIELLASKTANQDHQNQNSVIIDESDILCGRACTSSKFVATSTPIGRTVQKTAKTTANNGEKQDGSVECEHCGKVFKKGKRALSTHLRFCSKAKEKQVLSTIEEKNGNESFLDNSALREFFPGLNAKKVQPRRVQTAKRGRGRMFNKQRGEGTRLVSRKSDKEDVNSENEGESSTTSTSSDEPSVSDGLQLQPTTSKTHAPPQTQYTQPTIEAEDEDESEVPNDNDSWANGTHYKEERQRKLAECYAANKKSNIINGSEIDATF